MVGTKHIGDDLDDLSNHLGFQYQERVEGIIEKLGEMTLPETYGGVITQAREAFAMYNELLEAIATTEDFAVHTER